MHRHRPLALQAWNGLTARGMNGIKYVAAFRAYAWDGDIEELAQRFFSATPGARKVVLIDETRGVIELPAGYEKVSHTEDSSPIGLPVIPIGKSLWHNVDYGIYFLRQALPDYDYYLLSESDLAVNLPLEPMMAELAEQGLDLVTHDIKPSDSEWYWHQDGVAVYGEPWRSLLYFMVLSNRAALALHEGRQALAARLAEGTLPVWPFCEIFVPTTLVRLDCFKMADVSAFADTTNLYFRPRYAQHDPIANRPGSLVHSVLGRERFISTVLAENRASDFFRPGSDLYNGFRKEPLTTVYSHLRRALVQRREHAALAALESEMGTTREKTAPSTTDLALSKPALVSSVGRYSQFADPQMEACGANSEIVADEYGFHTDLEQDPWWMVDLLAECVIDRLSITNRAEAAYRFRTFIVESSRFGTEWITRYMKLTIDDVSADLENPWVLDVSDPFVARLVRIRLLGREPLHLRRVQMFGRQIAG